MTAPQKLILPRLELFKSGHTFPHRVRELATYTDERGTVYRVISNWPRTRFWAYATGDGMKRSNAIGTNSHAKAEEWAAFVRAGKVEVGETDAQKRKRLKLEEERRAFVERFERELTPLGLVKVPQREEYLLNTKIGTLSIRTLTPNFIHSRFESTEEARKHLDVGYGGKWNLDGEPGEDLVATFKTLLGAFGLVIG